MRGKDAASGNQPDGQPESHSTEGGLRREVTRTEGGVIWSEPVLHELMVRVGQGLMDPL